MSNHINNNSYPNSYTCKWCGVKNPTCVFENADLCDLCRQKAIHAERNPELCQVCSTLMTNTKSNEKIFSDDGIDFSTDLQRGSEHGCGLCRIFLLQDPNNDPGRFVSLGTLRAGTLIGNDDRTVQQQMPRDFNYFCYQSEGDHFRLYLSVSACPDDPSSKYISQRPPESNLRSTSIIQQTQKWLKECLCSHSESLIEGDTPIESPCLPTRVIDVGAESNPEVRLYQPESVVYENYIALSYCWGTDRFITTTSATIDAHKEHFNTSTLPQTFQDAIITTRRLGFRYLWIDALCIIQDSPEDKSKEINTMGAIYSNAVLTIAVVNASRVAEGFLQARSQPFVELPYRCPDGAMGKIQVSVQREISLRKEPLYTRGWCLQENLLSARILLYTDTEVIWQCQSTPMKRIDTTHVSYEDSNPKFSTSPFRRLPADVFSPIQPSDETQDLSADVSRYATWRSLVEMYSGRKLTVPEDRFPALAGIVSKFEKAWSDEYCAGIWKHQFIPSMTWRRTKRFSREYHPQLKAYRAPTWSWASIDGPVEFDSRFDIGNARGLQARLISCEFDMSSNSDGKAIFEASIIPLAKLPTDQIRSFAEVYFDDPPTFPTMPEDKWPANRILDLDEDMMQRAWCMLLGEGRDGVGKMSRTVGLILTSKSEETFERIGLYTSVMKGLSKLWVGAANRRIVTIV